MIDQAVVLAAGRGIRPGPLTADRPKAMLPTLGRPLVARVIERLHEAGIGRCVVIVGEEEGAVASYLHNFHAPNMDVSFCLQASSSDLGDAIAQAAGGLKGPFVLVSSELLLPADFLPRLVRQFDSSDKDLILGVVQTRQKRQEGLLPVNLDADTITAVLDPSQQADGGEYGAFLAYACSPGMLPYLTGKLVPLRTEHDFSSVLRQMIADERHIGCAMSAWFLRLVEDGDLLAINRHLLREERDAHILSELPGSVHIIPPVRIDPNVSVGQGARIGPYVYLERACVVGQGAVVSDSVVLANAVVHAGEHLHGQVVARRRSTS